jgi:hypothetical protein
MRFGTLRHGDSERIRKAATRREKYNCKIARVEAADNGWLSSKHQHSAPSIASLKTIATEPVDAKEGADA